ncbi:hypothetical protein C900_00383 [Fulvivirga imtechensis AK7]|uniref:Outer membrane protein beta-barrel domain-containing protein n=1 Tax=Fulvivirga imtechensis AK7 TaxID=1237149 RepID=L8JHX0_9BACT|nr:hypothetical protein C900_00383 [Fulvivirga imtechensis AK7]
MGLLSGLNSHAQDRTDSLIINVGKSKIIFLVRDKQDLETLKNYDLNEILKQLSLKLENDSTEQALVKEQNGKKTYLSDTTIVVEEPEVKVAEQREVQRYEYKDRDNERDEHWRTKRFIKGTRHYFNIDLGTNNYVQDGNFPDETDEPYTVRPFGSWYVALTSTNQTHIGGPLYLEWGPSVSWYNFKFQNDRIRVIDGPDANIFEEDTSLPNADFKKSKLTVAYINFSVVPMFSFGEPERKEKKDFWDWKDWNDDDDRGFRIGIGGYGGYRIASYTKVVYKEDDDKEKDKNKDNFHLNNFRYGLRLQMGYRGTDLFFNYDLNELFAEGKGPQLNAFSFGLTF